MNSVRQILEIDRVLENVRKYAKTSLGSSFFDSLDVYENKDECESELLKCKEMMCIINSKSDLPLVSSLDIEGEIRNIKKGLILDEYKFNLLKQEIICVKELLNFYSKLTEKPKLLDEYFGKLFYLEKLFNEINNTITIEDKVSDNASKKLFTIRRNLANADKEIHSCISKLLIKYKDQLSGDSYVLRNNTFVLPINTSLKASVDGVIHDVSDSGVTTFIEPLEILNFQNKKHLLELEEKEEVTRILRDLTELVLLNENKLITNSKIITYFDVLQSKVHYCFEINGTFPILNNKYEIKLYNARHPLLDKNVVVANDFSLIGEKNMMLISGPNAGGKTVALKTVAIAGYMAKMGLPICANDDSEIAFFRKIYVEIGDSQSLENNLSTFSAHISILSVILKYITSKDLVIIDELGNGTDPKEGESLSMAVAEFLLNKKCHTLITSHYNLLKVFGLKNKNIFSASFIFDEKKIEPKFKIIYNVSGKSYGFDIAKKYGINEEIVNRSIEIYNDNYMDEETKKINLIEDKERQIFEKSAELDRKLEEFNSVKNELDEREKILAEKESKLKEKKLDYLDEEIDKKLEKIDDIIEELKKNQNIDKKQIVKVVDELRVTPKEEIFVGNYVEIKALKLRGKVVRIDKDKLTVVTEDGFTMKTSNDKCFKVAGPSNYKPKSSNIDVKILDKKITSGSINLIGYHIDEALFALDSYLADCLQSGLKEVKIIHGFGSGHLRMAIHSHLKNNKYVKSYRLGDNLDGGGGSTIVVLK